MLALAMLTAAALQPAAAEERRSDSDLVRERPWVGAVFFYWYTWDDDKQWGSWAGQGVHNTPLDGYYDSRTFADNRRSLWRAAEWGLTHLWMDYWSPTWKGEGGVMRETIVMRAAEDLRKAGYNIWMSYYQDGDNFAMTDFVKNVSEKRDVHQWLRDFSQSPVWPKVRGRPHQLVYGRNGTPTLSVDHDRFRDYLRKHYDTIAALNEDWGTEHPSFAEIEMDLGARGPHRAWSAKVQHEIWRAKWRELNEAVEEEFGWPGMVASFDVGYGPYQNLGYAEYAKTFGGPHSYGGIFDVPHDQDAHRFIQANVCRAYYAVFFDHYKNCYHDWNIRVPGMAYLPDPFHFDRFWVGDLMRYAEANLHLSWNEWWEGSNLEPCKEWGKTFCEKNLFYSTIMQLGYESIRNAQNGARLALLLNDYANLAGSLHQEEIRATLQGLRRLGAHVALLPDDFVTEARLADFDVVIAPAARIGFGYNLNDQRIAPLLLDWVKDDARRRLIVSADETIRRALDLEVETKDSPPSKAGPDLNLFIDVGAEGDDRYLVAGRSHRETWNRVPPGMLGAGKDLTVRWTPGQGTTATLIVPLSPGRDHVLRIAGSAIWASTASVRLDGKPVGTLAITPGLKEYELPIAKAAVGARSCGTIDIAYDPLNVPKERAPERYGSEARRCNLAVDWVQLSTSNLPARTTKQQHQAGSERIRFGSALLGELRGRGRAVAARPRQRLVARGARLASVYDDGSPRDMICRLGKGQVWYVSGLLHDVDDPRYWRNMLTNWAKAPPREFVRGSHTMSARLSAGLTDLLLACNEDPSKPDAIRCRLPARSAPVSEAVALAKDGATYRPIEVQRDRAWLTWQDKLRYVAVYQVAHAPIRVETGPIIAGVGQSRAVRAKVTNLTDRPVKATLRFRSVIPTLSGEPVEVSLWPRDARDLTIPLRVAETCDWGKKTAVIEIAWEGKSAMLWREVVVTRPPELSLSRSITTAHSPEVAVANAPSPHGLGAPALEVVASLAGQSVALGQAPAGGQVSRRLPMPIRVGQADARDTPGVDEPARLEPRRVVLRCRDGSRRLKTEDQLWVAKPAASAAKFPGALAAVSVFNPSSRRLDGQVVDLDLPGELAQAEAYHLRDPRGRAYAAQRVGKTTLLFPVTIGPESAAGYTLCRGPGRDATSDLKLIDDRKKDNTVTVTNAFFEVTIDGRAGGTVSRLVSRKTGRDYGLRSFDVNYGRFGSYDPNQPATNTVRYVTEKKTALSTKPCTWQGLETGPCRAVVDVSAKSDRLRSRTRYEFRAGTPHFRIRRRVELMGGETPQEIVVLDARFKRHDWLKSYPNFVGLVRDGVQPHFGWRYGPWVPEVFTLMRPPEFDESLSILVLRKDGLDRVRQGFWPEHRPQPGPCSQARIELISTDDRPSDIDCRVLLHGGHQPVAYAARNDLIDPPLVTLTRNPLWREPR